MLLLYERKMLFTGRIIVKATHLFVRVMGLFCLGLAVYCYDSYVRFYRIFDMFLIGAVVFGVMGLTLVLL
ncbi:MAG: hypothetical protein HC828_22070 [Blastochloris sp.]|nr:hypothetical protein [Blastochloris sp.]